MELLKGKVIIVIGGLGFLGTAFVSGINEEGGTTVIGDIITGDRSGVLPDSNAMVEHVDITDQSSIDRVLEKVNTTYGKIDAVVNTAYPRNENYGKKFEDVMYQDFCENVSLHLGGYFLVSQRSAEFFNRQGFGNMVNIASIQGVGAPKFDTYNGTQMTSPVEYSAIKAGIINLSKYIAKYYAGKNIRVNCISPGGILNNQNDVFLRQYKKYTLNKGMLDREDIKGTLIFLLSDLSEFINGQNIIVDDGWTL